MRHPLQPPTPPTLARELAAPDVASPASIVPMLGSRAAIPVTADLLRASRHAVPEGAYHTSAAEELMRRMNPRVLVADEGGNVVFIEDVLDPDGRMFRMEYRATADGRRAYGWCLHNPWGGRGNPSAGVAYSTGHVREDGFLCLGNGMTNSVASSPFSLEAVVQRSRFWCTAFSVYSETGSFPNP